MKNLFLYEEFSPNENPVTGELTSGEKAALSKGLELMTLEQAAVCYLFAKEKYDLVDRAIRSSSGYTYSSYKTYDSKDLSTLIGMKIGSFTYAVKKFRILLGLEERGEQNIYEKIKKFFDELVELTLEDLTQLASGAFTEESLRKGESFRTGEELDKKRRSIEQTREIFKVKDYYKSLLSMYMDRMSLSYPEASQKAIKSTASKLNLDYKNVEKIVKS